MHCGHANAGFKEIKDLTQSLRCRDNDGDYELEKE